MSAESKVNPPRGFGYLPCPLCHEVETVVAIDLHDMSSEDCCRCTPLLLPCSPLAKPLLHCCAASVEQTTIRSTASCLPRLRKLSNPLDTP